MTRQRKDTPKTPRSQRASSKSISSTPRRSFPSNPILRSLSTPLHSRSYHPLLRALSTPIRRRSEYHPLVRRLCQEGAHERLPYDNALYVTKALRCERCVKTGTFTQNIAFKQGHAGEWVRACQTPGCGLVAYPAQPGTPPDLLARIEAAREATGSSSTVATPNSHSHTPHSSASFSSNQSQDLDVTPSIGGKLEDWLSPLFWELDMECMNPVPTTSSSASPDRVAGPSTGDGLGPLHSTPPQCARDEELARILQVAVDKEDVLLLQQLENVSSPEASPVASDYGRKLTTVSSLTAELSAITGPQVRQPEASLSTLPPVSPNVNVPSRHISRESSPSPRPRKKKRILFKRSPTPPPIKRRYYGPRPASPSPGVRAKGKASASKTKSANSNAGITSTKPDPAKPNAESSAAKPVQPQGGDPHPSTIIVISSGDESAHADEDSVIDITSSDPDSDSPPPATQWRGDSPPLATQPHTVLRRVGRLSARRLPTVTPPRSVGPSPATQPSREDSLPPATQPRTALRRVGRLSTRHPPPATQPRHDDPPPDTEPRRDSPPPATQPRTTLRRGGQVNARRSPSATRPRHDDPLPDTEPRRGSPPPVTQTRPKPRRVGRLSAWRPPPATRRRNDSPLPATQPRSQRPDAIPPSARARRTASADEEENVAEHKVITVSSSESDRDSPRSTSQRRRATSRKVAKSAAPSRDVEARGRPTPRPSESDSASLPTQRRAVIRSRAPSREVEPHTRLTYSNMETDGALASTHPRTALRAGTRSLPTSVDGLQETGSSNKENHCLGAAQSGLDSRASTRLSAHQAAARRRPGVFASLAQSSSSPSSSSSSSSSSLDGLDDDASHVPDAVDRQLADVQPDPDENTVEQVDAAEVFGDPFRFEIYPPIPELAMDVNPDTERRHWVLTVKIWYKNNMPPSTKMIPLDHISCSIRLSDVFIVSRTLRPAGYTHFRIWNRFTTDWETRSLHDDLAVSIADNHTLLIRLPTVATLSSWPENISQVYGACQTVDPRREPSSKGKELAYT